MSKNFLKLFILGGALTWASNCMAVTSDPYPAGVNPSAKMLPVVTYSPVNFYDAIKTSFFFDKNREYIFYDSTIKEKNMGPIHSKDTYKFDKNKNSYTVDLPERQSPFISYNNRHPIFSNFRPYPVKSPLSASQLEVLTTEDSVFVFQPVIPYINVRTIDFSTIGFIRNGEILIADYDETLKLSAFLKKKYNSLQNFMQEYLSSVERQFRYEGSGLYFIESDNAAIDILKNSYFFRLLDGADEDTVCNLFLCKINSRMKLTERQTDCLKAVIANAVKKREDILGRFLASGNANILSERYYDYATKLSDYKFAFSNQEREIAEEYLSEASSLTYYAYDRLRRDVPNVDSEGRYLSDRDEFKIIAERVRNHKNP